MQVSSPILADVQFQPCLTLALKSSADCCLQPAANNNWAGTFLHLAFPDVGDNAGLLYFRLLRQVLAPAGVDEIPEVEEGATGEGATGEVEWGLETLVRVGENWIDKLDMVGCIWPSTALCRQHC